LGKAEAAAAAAASLLLLLLQVYLQLKQQVNLPLKQVKI
jgi:hypothetical protein